MYSHKNIQIFLARFKIISPITSVNILDFTLELCRFLYINVQTIIYVALKFELLMWYDRASFSLSLFVYMLNISYLWVPQ